MYIRCISPYLKSKRPLEWKLALVNFLLHQTIILITSVVLFIPNAKLEQIKIVAYFQGQLGIVLKTFLIWTHLLKSKQ